MRCSHLCIGLILVGIGGAAIFAYSGNTQAVYFLSILPFLACPLMCVFMMMGHKRGDKECDAHNRKSASPRSHVEK